MNLIDCNTKATLRESDFEAEKILVDKRTMYRCKVCWWISPHILDYKKHRNKNCFVNVKTVGDVVNYECRVCAKLFCEVPTNSKTIYVCNICKKKNSLSKERLLQHVSRHHKQSSSDSIYAVYCCGECDKKFKTYDFLVHHYKKHSGKFTSTKFNGNSFN